MHYVQDNYSTLVGVSTALIYGYGVEGQSSERFLKNHFPGIKIMIHDETDPKHSKKRDPSRYDIVVVSPGVDRRDLAKYPTAKLTSNTELFFELLPEIQRAKILAVTGTKGKSTTVKYLLELLVSLGFRAEVGGNYGLAMLELLDVVEECDFVVLELSSFQLENLTVSPHYAGLVSFYEDHLDRHGSREKYFEAKSNIFKHQTPGDFLFVPESWEQFLEPAHSVVESMISDEESRVVIAPVLNAEYFGRDSTLRSVHIRNNLGVVAEMVRKLVAHDPDIETKIKDFSAQFVSLEHRLEFVAEVEGRKYINDSQSTNQYSSIAGMQTFGEDLGTILLGGKNKGNDYTLLVDEVLKLHPFVVILDTEAGLIIKDLLEKSGYEQYVLASSFGEAVSVAHQMTEPGKVVLLSPAAASFGWFNNYKDRGDQFKRLVNELE